MNQVQPAFRGEAQEIWLPAAKRPRYCGPKQDKASDDQYKGNRPSSTPVLKATSASVRFWGLPIARGLCKAEAVDETEPLR